MNLRDVGQYLAWRDEIELAAAGIKETGYKNRSRVLIIRLEYRVSFCIDATGLGMQLAERARERFGWKVEPINFTSALKEELDFNLRTAFEDRRLRIQPDPKLRADLHGIKKVVTSSGNIRFLIDNEDDGRHASGHCDRFWALALRQHAANHRPKMGAAVA